MAVLIVTAVTISPRFTSQRPVRRAADGAAQPRDTVAANVPAWPIRTVMSAGPGRSPVCGYHALNTDSLAENSTRSQGVP